MNRHATQPACASREFPQEHLALQIIYLHVQASANEEQWILWMKYDTSNGNLLVTENLLRVSPWEPMNHDMVSIGNNGCKIVSLAMPDNLDHSSWMWNEYHPVPLSPGTSHLFSILPIVQMWIVMMDGGILPGIFKQCNLIRCINPLLNPPFTVWTDQNNSSANTCRYNVATGSRTPDEGFLRIPNATCRQLFTMQQIWPLLWNAKLWCSDQ